MSNVHGRSCVHGLVCSWMSVGWATCKRMEHCASCLSPSMHCNGLSFYMQTGMFCWAQLWRDKAVDILTKHCNSFEHRCWHTYHWGHNREHVFATPTQMSYFCMSVLSPPYTSHSDELGKAHKSVPGHLPLWAFNTLDFCFSMRFFFYEITVHLQRAPTAECLPIAQISFQNLPQTWNEFFHAKHDRSPTNNWTVLFGSSGQSKPNSPSWIVQYNLYATQILKRSNLLRQTILPTKWCITKNTLADHGQFALDLGKLTSRSLEYKRNYPFLSVHSIPITVLIWQEDQALQALKSETGTIYLNKGHNQHMNGRSADHEFPWAVPSGRRPPPRIDGLRYQRNTQTELRLQSFWSERQ